MKKRIGRRQLIENLRETRAERDLAALERRAAEDDARRQRELADKWRERVARLENDPDLQYAGTVPGGTLVQAERIDISTAVRMKDDWETREYIRRALARKLADAIIDQGLMRVEYGGEPDSLNIRADPYQTVRVIARLDVLPWDRMVRRTANGMVLELRRFYEARMVPPVYEDMARNAELAQDSPAPWK